MTTLFQTTEGVLLDSGEGYAIGAGDNFNYPTPWRIRNDVATISTGRYISFITDDSGVPWASGINVSGWLGIGTMGGDVMSFTRVKYG